jgi:hypothetical protein
MIYVLYVIRFTRPQLKKQLDLTVEDVFKFLKSYMVKLIYNVTNNNTNSNKNTTNNNNSNNNN